MPKYCENYKIQGHNEQQCYVLRLKLYSKTNIQMEDNKKMEQESRDKDKDPRGKKGRKLKHMGKTNEKGQ